MKNKALLLVLTVITCTTCLQAQVQKGYLLLGATPGFKSTDDHDTYSSSNTNLAPRVSLGIGGNSVLGLRTNMFSNFTFGLDFILGRK